MHTVIDLKDFPPSEAQEILFRRLFEHMVADTPPVPITADGANLVAGWRDEILAGEILEHAFGTWGQLFTSIRWETSDAGDGPFCGADVIQFLGHVGEAIQRFGPATMPLDIALMALIACQAEGGVVALDCDRSTRWSVRMLPRAHGALGLNGRISLTNCVGLFDVPQEIFENFYAGELIGDRATGRTVRQAH